MPSASGSICTARRMQAVRFTPHILVSSVLGGFAITARVARGAAAAAGEWRAVARAAAHAWGVAWAALAGDLAAPDDPAAAAAVALWHLPSAHGRSSPGMLISRGETRSWPGRTTELPDLRGPIGSRRRRSGRGQHMCTGLAHVAAAPPPIPPRTRAGTAHLAGAGQDHPRARCSGV